MDKFEVCEEIGHWYGRYFTEDIYLCVDTGDRVYKYETAEEFLIDWLDTLVDEDKATKRNTWSDVIEFINKEILQK